MRDSHFVRQASPASFIALLIILTFPHLSQAQAQLGPYIQSASPTFNYVDPRQPQGTATGAPPQGVDTLMVTFSEPVGDLVTWTTPEILEPLTQENFQLSFFKSGQWTDDPDLTLLSSPFINDVTGSGRGPYTLSLSQRLPLGAWTVLYAKDIVGQSGNLLVASNGAIRLILGNRPMDIDGNGLHSFSDWVRWRSYALGTLSPIPMALVDYLDIDRSGSLSLPGLLSDTFRARQLLDGPPPLQAWKAYDMGPKPPVDCIINQPPNPELQVTELGDGHYLFDVSASTDPDLGIEGQFIAFRLAFGDGSSTSWSLNPIIEHQYNVPGTFQVTLTATDYCGRENAASQTITVEGKTLSRVTDLPPVANPILTTENLVSFQGKLFFSYDNGIYGKELWSTDGTDAGTSLVKDIVPGITGSNPTPLKVVGNILFFIADDEVHGSELWGTDGTPGGTLLVKDTVPGPIGGVNSAWAQWSLAIGGLLYFNGPAPQPASEFAWGTIWRSDGSDRGTSIIVTLQDSASDFALILAEAGSSFLYTVDHFATFPLTTELWAYSTVSRRATKISNGVEILTGDNATYNGFTYFTSHGGLYKTDLTNATLVKGNSSFQPYRMTAAGSNLYFGASDATSGTELWKTDGTTAGTVLIRDINPGAASSDPDSLIEVNGTLFFTADNGTNGRELWKSDGTTPGTVMVKDILPGSSSSTPTSLLKVNNLLYFSAFTSTNGRELWKSDGGSGGTVMVADSIPGSEGTSPSNLTLVGGKIYYRALNRGLWVSDGTAQNTMQIVKQGEWSSYYMGMTAHNGSLYFSATLDAQGEELWKTTGSSAPTRVKDINNGSGYSKPRNLTTVNNTLYFNAYTFSSGRELWRSDGSDNGTVMVKDLKPGTSSSTPNALTAVGNFLYFDTNLDKQLDLWRSDGTEANTTVVKRVLENTTALTSQKSPVNGTLYFIVDNFPTDVTLWKSDSSQGAPQIVKEVGSDNEHLLTTFNNALYFRQEFSTNSGRQSELWKSNGTAPGTELVANLVGSIKEMKPVGGNLFISITLENGGLVLWKTNGTSGGTSLVKDFGLQVDQITNLTDLDGILLFLTSDDVIGYQLWRSDGTELGTTLLKTFPAGLPSTSPDSFTAIGSKLFFTADDGVHGRELWQSNGTATGTVLVQDIYPGGASANPHNLTALDGVLYFIANDGAHSFELWKY